MMGKTRCIVWILSWFVLTSQAVFSQDGFISVKSNFDVASTADRLVKVLDQKGMKIFARIDHAAGAASVGEALAPTELILFGNPGIGTGLMQCARSTGIDLPMKALIWEAEDGTTWLGYNNGGYISSRHRLKGCDAIIEKVNKALANFANAATQD